MIPLQYHQLARQVHQERIEAALRPRPEWPLPKTPRPAECSWCSIAARFRSALLARWPMPLIPRVASRRA
jgi:hypothetical protein